MKFNGEYIDLFGEKLLLHERTFKDAQDLVEWMFGNKKIESASFEATVKLNFLIDALKFNVEKHPFASNHLFTKKYWYRPFRKRKLLKLFSPEFLKNNLSSRMVDELIHKVRFNLEKQKNNSKEGTVLSRTLMLQMVSQYSGITWEEAENLSVSEFEARLEQALNIYNSERGGELNLKSRDQLERESNKELEYVKKVMKQRDAQKQEEKQNG